MNLDERRFVPVKIDKSFLKSSVVRIFHLVQISYLAEQALIEKIGSFSPQNTVFTPFRLNFIHDNVKSVPGKSNRLGKRTGRCILAQAV